MIETGVNSVVADTGIIDSVVWHDGRALEVFYGGITRIVAYQENGQMAAQPWVAAYKGDALVARADLAGAIVRYKQGEV